MICAHCGESTQARPCARCGEEPVLEGRYTLLEQLGQGAHGTTFKARMGPEGPLVAVKELPLGRRATQKAEELFLREASVLRQLDHPRIPTLHESFVAGIGRGRTLYIVQDFVDGQDLDAVLAGQRFSEDEVLALLAELCVILAYLHGRSPPVVHRDLKPGNVVRRPDGSLVLVDFGAVQDALRGSLGGGSTVAGTFGYMAPEQLVGDAGPRSDLYALGALGAHLLTRKSPVELLDRVGTMHWREHAAVSEGTAALLDALLSPDPESRPASAAQVAETIASIRTGGFRSQEPPADPPEEPGGTPAARTEDAEIAQLRTSSTIARLLRGGESKLIYTTVLPAGLDDHEVELLIAGLEDRLDVPGSLRRVASGWRWRGQTPQRILQASLEPTPDGGLRVELRESMGNLAGGLHGGIVGGVGGGIGGGVGWIFFMKSILLGLGFVGAVVIGSWLLARFLFAQVSKSRGDDLERALEAMQAQGDAMRQATRTPRSLSAEKRGRRTPQRES